MFNPRENPPPQGKNTVPNSGLLTSSQLRQSLERQYKWVQGWQKKEEEAQEQRLLDKEKRRKDSERLDRLKKTLSLGQHLNSDDQEWFDKENHRRARHHIQVNYNKSHQQPADCEPAYTHPYYTSTYPLHQPEQRLPTQPASVYAYGSNSSLPYLYQDHSQEEVVVPDEPVIKNYMEEQNQDDTPDLLYEDYRETQSDRSWRRTPDSEHYHSV